jgi:hypothetical protein
MPIASKAVQTQTADASFLITLMMRHGGPVFPIKLAVGHVSGMSGLKSTVNGLPLQHIADAGGLPFTNRELLLVAQGE